MIQPNAEWDNYWRAARIQRHEVDPTGTEEIAPFFLAEGPSPEEALSVVDLGCGAGALSSILIQSNYSQSKFLGVDLSYDGAKMAVNKTNGLAVQSDLSELPIAAKSIDWVVSQFALEYAPAIAWVEAGRIVKPGGRLTVVAHARGSLIYEEHQQAAGDFGALDQIIEVNFALDDEGNLIGFRGEQPLRQTSGQLQAMVDDRPVGLAKPMIEALVDRLLRLSEGKHPLSKIELTPLQEWITDYSFYKARVDSMLSAALSPADFMNIQQSLVSAGFTIQTAGFLTLPGGARLGFKISALKDVYS